jgi:hypothetical protein
VVAGARVGGQTIVAGAGFEITHMGILAPVAVVAAGSFGGPPAARAVVVVVTNTVPMEFRTPPSELCTGPGRTAAAAASPPAASAPAAGLAASLALAAVVVGVMAPARSLRERRPLLYRIVPALFSLSVREGGLPGHRPAGVLSQYAIHIVRHHPATEPNSLSAWISVLTYCTRRLILLTSNI